MTHLVPVLRPVLGSPFRRSDLYRIAGALPALHLSPRITGTWNDLITGTDLTTFSRANTSPTYELDGAGGLVAFTSGQRAIGYSPETGVRGGSIFGQRTQLLTGTEDLSSGLTPTNATRNLNVIAAPNGTITADSLIETSATGLHSQEIVDFVFTANTTYTFSCFAKSIGGRSFCPGFPTVFGSARFGRFDLSGNGSVLSADAGVTATIQPYANGWYRCFITSTVGATGGGARVGLFIGSGTSISYAGDTSKGLYIWGANLTAGSVLYPYIGGAITCPADVLTIEAAQMGFYQQPFTCYVRGTLAGNTNGTFPYLFSLVGANANTDAIGLAYTANAGTLRLGITSSGTQTVDIAGGTSKVAGSPFTAAFAVSSQSANISVDGSTEAEDTSVTVPTVTRIQFGGPTRFQPQANLYFHDVAIFPGRLSNSVIRSLATA